MEKGKLIIFVGPSGVGKATIEKLLFQKKELDIEFSISATTRHPRPGEMNGVDYYFISNDEFANKISNHKFLE
jgi:guanylate kinase